MTHAEVETLKLALNALKSAAAELYRASSYCNTYEVLGNTNDAITAIQKYLAAQPAVPEGWMLVPIEPTPEMLAVCDEDVGSKIIDGPAFAEAVWMSFLAAAPEKGN